LFIYLFKDALSLNKSCNAKQKFTR